jgi:hypothetical protein
MFSFRRLFVPACRRASSSAIPEPPPVDRILLGFELQGVLGAAAKGVIVLVLARVSSPVWLARTRPSASAVTAAMAPVSAMSVQARWKRWSAFAGVGVPRRTIRVEMPRTAPIWRMQLLIAPPVA